MPALIEGLLATPDNVERVRDKIAEILKLEFVHQAEIGGDPAPRVFVERSRPWGVLVESPVDVVPIVNVWFDTASFDGASSNISERQRCDGTFNVDVYAFATSEATDDGHTPGDQASALACQRTLRRVRQILMSAHYVYLGMRGVVGKRWPQAISMFQPPSDERATHHVIAGRLALVVSFNEFSPQAEGEPLDTLAVEVHRAETGELYLQGSYPPRRGSP